MKHRTADPNRSEAVRANPAPAPAPAPMIPAGIVAAAVSGLVGAWIAAGDVGLVGHPLRHLLTWLVIAVAVVGAWPQQRTWSRILAVLAGVAAAILMTASSFTAVNVLALAVLLAGLSAARLGADQKVISLVSQAVAIFGLYRVAVLSVPLLWSAADGLGNGMGRLGGLIAGQPLVVGSSFAGVDCLVLMAAFLGLWLAGTPGPRWRRGLVAGACIVAGHLVYLVMLAFAARLMDVMPTPPPAPTGVYAPPDKPWVFWAAVRTLVPWNLPAVAVLIQAVIACAMLRWSPPTAPSGEPKPCRSLLARESILTVAAALVAVILPVATGLYPVPANLAGKKFVANEKGFLNWLKPKHGEYGRLMIGMYGALPDLVESFGGTLIRTTDFSAQDLDGASAVILLYPNKPWESGQLERLWEFVRRGGSLLIMGEHTVRESDGGSRFNDVLAPTNMRVQFDCAQWAVGGWLDCYEAQAHPVTAVGYNSGRNDFGVVIGASVATAWPARPIILGRWGWSDWGDAGSSRALMGNDRYDGGERLGDVILAAEQSLGLGKIIVFGDTSSMTNGINIGSYGFTSSLLGYLAGPGAAAPLWRQGLGLMAAVAALVLLLLRPRLWRTAAVALAAALSLLACMAITHRASVTLPDGRLQQPNNLAYIDASHLEAFSPEALRDEGIMGLELTLMRDGFLTLTMNDFSAEALERAGLFISIGPAREFSPSQRRAVRDFVANGGVFICTVGHDRAEAVAPLLKDFGLRAGEPGSPDKEPIPLGYFKSPYLQADGAMHYVRFHAAWSVAEDDSGLAPNETERLGRARPIAYGRENVPVILVRPYGKGRAVLVGDTNFAMNVNLEHMDGSPFEGMRENADFWRWFLADLTGRPAWTPAAPPKPGPGPSGAKAVP